jgi:DNA-binding CsgD family transcriptional regulator
MQLVEKTRDGLQSLPVRLVSPPALRPATAPLATRILQLLAESPSYPKEIARTLKVHEQLVYYHVRRLEKARIIRHARSEARQGALANYYELAAPALAVAFTPFAPAAKLPGGGGEGFLAPFIEDGRLNARIIVGSPDPHGPDMARSRDGYYGMDIALFLGTFLTSVGELTVRLDTEVTEDDLRRNLILIGGPIVNTVTGRINEKLPVRFDPQKHWAVHSTLSGTHYHEDAAGVIVRAKNPFNPRAHVLLLAGKRSSGTRAVITAFLRHFAELAKGNRHKPDIFAKVVQGVDRDADGIIDDAQVLE